MKTNSLSFVDSKLFWSLFFSVTKSSCILSSASSLIMISMLFFFNALHKHFITSHERKKVICYCYWVNFQLILFYFCHHYSSIHYSCYSNNYLLLLVYNNVLLFSCSERFLISLSVLSLIALVSFCCLKSCLMSLIAVYFCFLVQKYFFYL